MYIYIYTSNQIRTDDIYVEGRGYTNLTILVSLFIIKNLKVKNKKN